MEFTGKTYEEALQKAKDYYEVSSDDSLDIKVMAEGSKGFLGLGAKDYVIKVEQLPNSLEKNINEFRSEQIENANQNDAISTIAAASVSSEEDIQAKMNHIQKFIKEIYNSIDIEPEIKTDYDGENINVVISGEGASALIGRRGQGLDALQFITGIVANKDADYKRVLIDIENYRDKRQASLEQYAKSMARKAVREKRNVRLEPMNPYERRIVHFALQGDKKIETYSQGEDPDRYVVISYKGYKKYDRITPSRVENEEQQPRPKYDYGEYKDETEEL